MGFRQLAQISMGADSVPKIFLYHYINTLCTIWHNLHILKILKNAHGGVLLFVKQSCFSKSATWLKVTFLHGCFSHFPITQIEQSITMMLQSTANRDSLKTRTFMMFSVLSMTYVHWMTIRNLETSGYFPGKLKWKRNLEINLVHFNYIYQLKPEKKNFPHLLMKEMVFLFKCQIWIVPHLEYSENNQKYFLLPKLFLVEINTS